MTKEEAIAKIGRLNQEREARIREFKEILGYYNGQIEALIDAFEIQVVAGREQAPTEDAEPSLVEVTS